MLFPSPFFRLLTLPVANAAFMRTCKIRFAFGRLWCLLILPFLPYAAQARHLKAKAPHWVGTWGTATQLVEPNNMPPAPGLSNNTLRQVICVSIGGKALRLKFSNEFGKTPLTIKAVQIAASAGGSAIEGATSKSLSFGGKPDITLMPGGTAMADPLAFNLKPRMLVAITIAFGEVPPVLTGHPGSRTTSYLVPGSQASAEADFGQAVTTDHWYVISGMDVDAPKGAAAVAVMGDSITDGRGSGTNKQDRWPDMLEISLQAKQPGKQIGMLNFGIGGNAVLRGGLGPTALTRYDRDILKQSGVRWVIIFEGVNDLGGTRDSVAAADVAQKLIAAYTQMIDQAHAQGLKVYGATITPINKSFYYKDYRETARHTINEWIRSSGHYDGVIDFDKMLSDPQDKLTLLPAAQSGDYLHPSELGYKMMGEGVEVNLFK